MDLPLMVSVHEGTVLLYKISCMLQDIFRVLHTTDRLRRGY